MKNLMILTLGLLIGSASFARTTELTKDEPTKPAATATLIGNDKLQIVIAPEDATARLVLKDAVGRVLYSSSVALQNGFLQKFDISELAVGDYQLAVSVGKAQTVKSFTVSQVPSYQLVTLQD